MLFINLCKERNIQNSIAPQVILWLLLTYKHTHMHTNPTHMCPISSHIYFLFLEMPLVNIYQQTAAQYHRLDTHYFSLKHWNNLSSPFPAFHFITSPLTLWALQSSNRTYIFCLYILWCSMTSWFFCSLYFFRLKCFFFLFSLQNSPIMIWLRCITYIVGVTLCIPSSHIILFLL